MARYIIAIVLLAFIAGAVFAQGRHRGAADNPLAAEDARKRKEAEEVEKRYNAMRQKADAAATPTRVDPWQNMRGADDSNTKR